ncbi:hypothetical protein DZK27_12045 [Rhodobacteraceae bacterium 63075]|nr:hypothetical protein DZK27_12045 [Rhodobacteraceae bacterium 63075]
MRIFLPILAAAGFLAGPALAYAPKVGCELDQGVKRGFTAAQEADSEDGELIGLTGTQLYGQPSG